MRKEKFILLFAILFLLANFSLVLAGTLRVTEEHPFLVNGNWEPAKNLSVGDILQTYDGRQVRIKNITDVVSEKPFFVYNLEDTLGINNYAAGLEGIVVHNSDAVVNELFPTRGSVTQLLFDKPTPPTLRFVDIKYRRPGYMMPLDVANHVGSISELEMLLADVQLPANPAIFKGLKIVTIGDDVIIFKVQPEVQGKYLQPHHTDVLRSAAIQKGYTFKTIGTPANPAETVKTFEKVLLEHPDLLKVSQGYEAIYSPGQRTLKIKVDSFISQMQMKHNIQISQADYEKGIQAVLDAFALPKNGAGHVKVLFADSTYSDWIKSQWTSP